MHTALTAGASQWMCLSDDVSHSGSQSAATLTCDYPLTLHCRPWLENHFMRNFFWRGFDYWYPLVPLFVQATDALFLGKAVATAKSLETFFSGSPAGSANQHDASAGSGRLRDDVIYVLVIQHDMGALAVVPDPHVWRNTLVLSAGGWGNVPLPLMTAGGCMQASPDQWARAAGAGSAAAAASNSLWESAIVRSHLLSFVGRVSYRDVSKAGGISDRIVDWRQDLMYNLAAALCFAEDAQQSVAASADGAAQPTPSELSGSADHRIGFTDEELVALGSDWLASSKRPTPPSTAPQLLSHEDLARLGLSSTEGDAGLDAGTNVHARKTTPRIRCGLHLQQWRRNDAWRRVTAESALVLATRGVGATSFRLYESLAAGRVPVYVWQDLLWLPYARAAETLWGPNGVAIVAEGTSAPAVLTSSVPELLRHRSATEVRGRPDAAAAIERGNAGAGQLSGGSFGTASDAGASTATSIESLVLQAAAQGRATKQHVPSARSALTSPTAPQTTGDDLAYAVPSTSHLAEMEARLRRLHDRYFTYDALMVHIDAFLRRPDASELHCEAKPYVMFTP